MRYEEAKATAFAGVALTQRLELDEALVTFQQAQSMFEAENNEYWLALLDLYRAQVFVSMRRFPEARSIGTAALEKFANMDIRSSRILTLILLARTAIDLGQYDEARLRAEEALHLTIHEYFLRQLDGRSAEGRRDAARGAECPPRFSTPFLLGALRVDRKTLKKFSATCIFQAFSCDLSVGEQSMRHLNAAMLIDLVEQRLPEAELSQYQDHVDHCTRCAAEYKAWWNFLTTLRPLRLHDAPEHLIAWATAIESPPSAGTGLRQLAAQLLLDSFQPASPAFGIRGAAGTRQLIFRVEDIDIHLRVIGQQGKRTIHGQLLPQRDGIPVAGARLNLLEQDKVSQSTVTNDFGEFCFRDAPAGSLTISVEVPYKSLIGFFQV